MFSSSFCYAQKDTIYTTDNSIENIIKASAKDSIFHDYKAKQLHLFGQAVIFYEEIVLSADYILVDFNKNEVFASYTYDKDSNRIGLPKFNDGSDEIIAAKIRYNFDSKKGFIQEVKLKQDENYLYMEVAKRQANEEIHFKKGRFTTCDLEEPHFHFQLSKAILIPKKRIVSGPMNLWVQGVPTPLGLPFAFIPQKKIEQKAHGFIFPQYTLQSQYGMGFQNLGYFIPVNDSLQTTFYANLYSRGSWGLSNQTSYKIKYKFDGNLNIGFQQLKNGFPSNDKINKLNVVWTHRQDQKANPLWTFSSNVNFVSDNSTKTNLDPLNKDYFQNSLNSDVNISRIFPGKPITAGMKVSVRQNSNIKNFAVTSPILNVNVTRFSPFAIFKRDKISSKKWYEQIVMTYNFEGQNRSSFHDSLVEQKRYDLIRQSFFNGVNQSSTMQSTISLFDNTWKLTPSVTYNNRINFQQIHKSYDSVSNNTKVDTINKTGMSQTVSFSTSLTTVLYNYYRFIGKNKPLMRHIITPSFSFRYNPKLSNLISDSVGVNKSLVTYSPFERSIYSESSSNSSAFLSFGFNNTFELKTKSKKDTITGFKKTRIIDGLSFTGTYDFLKDSMQLSRINASLRINPFDFINIVASSNLSPYDWNDSTNVETKDFAWKTRKQLVRIFSASINTSLIFATPKSRKKIRQNAISITDNWNADFQYYSLHPENLIDFEIPWRISLSHIFDINRSNTPIALGRQFNQNQTITFNSDFTFTQRWKILTDVYFDMKTKQVTNSRITLSRNLHCWNLSFFWIPIGSNQSFMFRLNANSNLFNDAKIELKKPPTFF
ncbi:MAG: putative LPS assembly protein LptD [Bacteroidota bacterium]